MPVPINEQNPPYAQEVLDTATAVDGFVDVQFTLHLTGTVAQVQADYATVAALNLSSPSALLAWSGA